MRTQGSCVWASKSYATDVFPIFKAQSCSSGNGGCHGGNRPSEGLNLETASIGYSQLVGVVSQQCTNRKRVVASDVPASYLVNKLTGVGMCSGSQMPKAGGGLSVSDLDVIRAGIYSGAQP